MAADKFAAFARAGLRLLQAALPLQHRPAVKVVLGQLAENALEINLPIPGRAKAPRPLQPVLIAAVHAAAAVATLGRNSASFTWNALIRAWKMSIKVR